MRGKNFPGILQAALAILALTLFARLAWAAPQEKVLHSFGNGTDGNLPEAGLISDAAGNLYGVTLVGGIHRYGTAFELSPREGGGWTEKVLHSFGNGTDGIEPKASLIRDAAGNLYGTTSAGGIHDWGTVFELSPNEDGSWTERVLHSFNYYGGDGSSPEGSLILDAAGNLYGTTGGGGIHGYGTVFEMISRDNGDWTETLLHSFGNGTDGRNPTAGLIFDSAGNLYGTTYAGGNHGGPAGYGTVFELSPRQDGGWTEQVLHSFNYGTDGYFPQGGLVFDHDGNLYGTTIYGGTHSCDGNSSCGTVFELSPQQDGGWREHVVHNFNNGTGARNPTTNLIIDAAGDLFGTTALGGIHDYGTVFKLSPNEEGDWTETVLHSFSYSGGDGANPEAGLILDAAGNLYSTTELGGIHIGGTVFEITP